MSDRARQMAEALSPEEQFLQQMSPVEALKFARQMENAKVYTPAQASANLKQTGMDIAYATPILGNILSAMDVPGYASEVVEKTRAGDDWAARKAMMATELSALGAIMPPFAGMGGRATEGAAARTNIFAGPMAKTSDHEALANAKRLEGSAPDDYRYVRATAGDSPDTGIGYMMFHGADGNIDDAVGEVGHYGKNVWLGKASDSVTPDEIRDDVVKSLLKEPELLKTYHQPGYHSDLRETAESLADEMTPSRIVDSAGFWDAPDLVHHIYETVLKPKGYKSVVTPDGMISFDPSAVKPYRP